MFMGSDKPVLDLVLRPNRSMQPRAFWAVAAGVALLFLAMAVRFLVLGAWPILPFMLADIALLCWAVRASYQSGGAVEYLLLDGGVLMVRKISAAGRERRIALEPAWARVDLEAIGEDENRLWLRSRGRTVQVGGFLSPPERADLAGVIRDGLARFAGSRAGSGGAAQ
jgi:uncharacterized membrane protein